MCPFLPPNHFLFLSLHHEETLTLLWDRGWNLAFPSSRLYLYEFDVYKKESLLHAICINKMRIIHFRKLWEANVKIVWLRVAPTGQRWNCIPELFS